MREWIDEEFMPIECRVRSFYNKSQVGQLPLYERWKEWKILLIKF